MNFVEAGLALRTHRERSLFERSADSPQQAQQELLLRLVHRNQRTAFGKDHEFPRIGVVADYQRLVPIRDYEKLRPYVGRLLAGERDVLTAEAPVMFATTSGTSGEPKFIPLTASWRNELGDLSRLWMSYAARDHQGCFGGSTLMVAGAAIEGFTEGGLPYGSMSGVLSQRIPWAVRRHFAIPYAVSLIADPDVRYFVTMRMALARSVTALATPNATTLIRLAETAASHSQGIIKAIHDGTLGLPTPELVPMASSELSEGLLRYCRPASARARELEVLLREHGRLRPRECWPRLKFIGCWLGGSVGVQAGRLEGWYGSAAQRDLGLIATEGRMTIPLEDGTPVGCLTIHRNFFEFILEGSLEGADPPVLLAHELELGKRYNVVVTGSNGLWRYDMNDLVEVRGFFKKTPTVAFIRKTRDVLSVTGEKVHVDQIQAAVVEAERIAGLETCQYRLVGDIERVGHDLLVEFRGRPTADRTQRFLSWFDSALARLNCEYASKRKSRRLKPPRLYAMRAGWSERQCREDFRHGRREYQYKWAVIREEWDVQSRGEVALAVDLEGEERCSRA